MEATITADGILKIDAENGVEAYALKKWIEENNTQKVSDKLMVNIDFQLTETELRNNLK